MWTVLTRLGFVLFLIGALWSAPAGAVTIPLEPLEPQFVSATSWYAGPPGDLHPVVGAESDYAFRADDLLRSSGTFALVPATAMRSTSAPGARSSGCRCSGSRRPWIWCSPSTWPGC